eukprot:COSAG01_NODE_10193_length_2224_cov_3.981176_2_plen_325_part_00
MQEFREGLRTLTQGGGVSEEVLEALMEAMDADGDGVVDYQEFVQCFARAERATQLAELVAQRLTGLTGWDGEPASVESVFKALDENGDGVISADELRGGLGKLGLHLSAEDMEAMVATVDVNGDGGLDYAEFVAQFAKSANEVGERSAAASSTIAAAARGRRERKALAEKRAASTKISAAARARRERKALAEQREAAVALQAVARGRQQRQKQRLSGSSVSSSQTSDSSQQPSDPAVINIPANTASVARFDHETASKDASELPPSMAPSAHSECEQCHTVVPSNMGRYDESNGLWYCGSCWAAYEEEEATGTYSVGAMFAEDDY